MLAEPSTPAVDSPAVTITSPVETASPASTQPTESTADAAAKAGDARAYRQARHQERLDAIEGKSKPAVEAKPAPVKPQGETQQPPKKKSLEGRRAQVNEDIESLKRDLAIKSELQRQLKALDLPVKKAETPTEPAKPVKPSWADDPKAPKLENFESYEAYLDARAEFIADKRYEQRMSERDQQTSRQSEATSRLESVSKQGEAFKGRMEAWQKANATVQIHPQLMEILPQSAVEAHNAFAPPDQQIPIGAEHFIIEQAFRSERPGELLAHFSQHPDVFERLYTLAHTDPAAVVRQIGAIEHQVTSSASPAPSPSARVSNVPPPPTVLGGRSSTLDPIGSAVKNGDARAFRQLRHAERLSRIAR